MPEASNIILPPHYFFIIFQNLINSKFCQTTSGLFIFHYFFKLRVQCMVRSSRHVFYVLKQCPMEWLASSNSFNFLVIAYYN